MAEELEDTKQRLGIRTARSTIVKEASNGLDSGVKNIPSVRELVLKLSGSLVKMFFATGMAMALSYPLYLLWLEFPLFIGLAKRILLFPYIFGRLS